MIKHLFNLVKSTQIVQKIVVNVHLTEHVRFNHYTSGTLWKAVLSVSNQGAKKGRGKRRGAGSIKDLNRGQELGSGKIKVEWPGLNSNVFEGKKSKDIVVIGEDTERTNRIVELRNKMEKFRRLSVPANERGFTGSTLNGKSAGSITSTDDTNYDGFETRIIDYKLIATTTSILGKKRQQSCLIITGNRNGVIGLGKGKGPKGVAAIRLAKKAASERLIFVNRYEDRTLFHNFYKEFYFTKIYAQQAPAGYGLRCHRIIKVICELVGIKDIYAKVDGSTNAANVAKCFIDGLLSQQKYQDIANAKGLNLVELRPDRLNYPVLLARPTNGPVRTPDQLQHEYESNVDLYLFDNRFRQRPPKNRPFYYEFETHKKHIQARLTTSAQKNSKQARLRTLSREALLKLSYPLRPKPKPVEAAAEAV